MGEQIARAQAEQRRLLEENARLQRRARAALDERAHARGGPPAAAAAVAATASTSGSGSGAGAAAAAQAAEEEGAQYRAALKRWGDLMAERARLEAGYAARVADAKLALEARMRRAEDVAAAFGEMRRRLALGGGGGSGGGGGGSGGAGGAASGRPGGGRRLGEAALAALEARERAADDALQAARLRALHLGRAERALEARMRGRGRLAGGLRPIDFEQLKAENLVGAVFTLLPCFAALSGIRLGRFACVLCFASVWLCEPNGPAVSQLTIIPLPTHKQSLGAKIRAREEELARLAEKSATAAHVLTHTREKAAAAARRAAALGDGLAAADGALAAARAALAALKHEREALRAEAARRAGACEHVAHPLLLADMDAQRARREDLRAELEALKRRHAELSAAAAVAAAGLPGPGAAAASSGPRSFTAGRSGGSSAARGRAGGRAGAGAKSATTSSAAAAVVHPRGAAAASSYAARRGGGGGGVAASGGLMGGGMRLGGSGGLGTARRW